MLFVGAIPRESVEQAFDIVRMDEVASAFVCCSGSFRFEQALAQRRPAAEIHRNDVSVLSTALARAVLKQPLQIEFVRELAFLEEHIRDDLDRLAATAVAVRMSHFSGRNAFAQAHVAHFRARARLYVEGARTRLEKYVAQLRLSSYYCGDFREHAAHAVAKGAHIFAWPPTYKGGYERLYRLLDQNTEWERPLYDIFRPDQLPAWLTELDEQGARYCVCADHELAGRKAQGYFKAGRSRGVYLYTSVARRASVRAKSNRSQAFGYTAADPSMLRAESVVSVERIDGARMNFLKDRYLAPGLEHVTGMASFIVRVDGALAGGFIYTASDAHFADSRLKPINTIYLLSDFSVSRDRRLSKLIAMLATGQEPVHAFDLKRVQRTEFLITTAFTNKPVSMKYRGVFSLLSRKPGQLNYLSEVRRVPSQSIYAEWWRRYAGADTHREDAA